MIGTLTHSIYTSELITIQRNISWHRICVKCVKLATRYLNLISKHAYDQYLITPIWWGDPWWAGEGGWSNGGHLRGEYKKHVIPSIRWNFLQIRAVFVFFSLQQNSAHFGNVFMH